MHSIKHSFLIFFSLAILVACQDDSPSTSNKENSINHNPPEYIGGQMRSFNMQGARDVINEMNAMGGSYPYQQNLNADGNDLYQITAAAVPVGYGCSNRSITKGGQEIYLTPEIMTTSTERLKAKRDYYDPIVKMAAFKHGIDPNFVHAVISQESRYTPTINGPPTDYGTAKGMMQLLDGTAREMGITNPLDVYVPAKNVDAGSKFLKMMIVQFKGDLSLAAAAYNAGPGTVRRCGNRISPFAGGQTLDYVKKVMGYANAIHKDAQKQQQMQRD